MKQHLLKISLFLAGGLLLIGACKPLPEIGSTPQSNSSSSAAILIIPKKKGKPDQEAPTVTIDWITPSKANLNVNTVGGKLLVKLRIQSATPIDLKQIEILVNGEPAGNKAGETGLMRRNEYKDDILTAQVPVKEGENAIQVIVTQSAEQKYIAEMTVNKDDSGVRVSNNQGSVSGTRVIWTKPDAFALKEHEMFNTKERELEIRFNISSPKRIIKSDVSILLNKRYIKPSSKAEFRGDAGSYYFKDIITLNDDLPYNEVALRVNTGATQEMSQKLKVNYSPIRPNLYVLTIGPQTNLKYTTNDARDIAGAFNQHRNDVFRLYNSITVDTLIGRKATTQAIRLAIASIQTKFRSGAIAEDDIVMLFFSSHGFLNNGDLYIQADDYNPSAAAVTSLHYQRDVLDQIANLPCKKLLFIDACHGGGARANSADINQALQDIKKAPRGLAIFASSSDQEQSYEHKLWKNGAFTEVLLKGLIEGKADGAPYGNKNGIVTLNELEKYVTREVPPIVNNVMSASQHPKLTRNELGDLPLFIINK